MNKRGGTGDPTPIAKETPTRPDGTGNASYLAAGSESGTRRLVDVFSDQMEGMAEAADIRAMHPGDVVGARDKLARFLCGWLNGPNRYRDKYGAINLAQAHAHLDIAPGHRDAWLTCTAKAIARQRYVEDFKHYIPVQLAVLANRLTTAT
ncbi:MAG: globin [Proteobacteria bacterium]|nr:MAG: globin [Pseudomonadota bacterium]